MKKLLLGFSFSLFVAVGFNSCSTAGCYTCTNIIYELDVCSDNVTGVGILNDAAAVSVKAAATGTKNEDYKNAAEAQGYTCTAK